MTRALDANGLSVNSLTDNIADLEADVKAHPDLGDAMQTGQGTRGGALLRVIAGRLTELDDLAQELYDAMTWGAAEGVQHDNLLALLGTQLIAAAASTVTLTLTGTLSTVIPLGARVRVPGGAYFALDAEATIGGGGTVDAEATCTETGPVEAAAATITEIVDAVAGWTGVTNAAAADPGRDVETVEESIVRLEQSRAGTGQGTPDAILTDILELVSVDACNVIDNDGGTTDSYGTLPHSIQVVIWPSTADQDDIVEVLWNHKTAGIRYSGIQSGTVTDAAGNTQTVYWAWATQISVYAVIQIDLRSGVLSAEAKTAIKAYVETWGNTMLPGADVEPDYLEAAILSEYGDTYKIARVSVYTAEGSAPTPPAGSGVLEIEPNEVARWSTTRITVEDM